jgi:predicted ATPase
MPATSGASTIALTSLSIRDFRGISNLELDFRGPDGQPNRLAVLAGPNGCGKTAALEAGLIAAGGHKLAVGQVGKKAIRQGARNYRIAGSFLRQDDPDAPWTIEVRSSHTEPLDRTPSINLWYFSSWRVPKLVGAVDVTVGRRGRRPAKTDTNRLHNVKQQLSNAAAIEKFRPGQRPLISRYTNWMTEINEAWREFYPEDTAEFFVDLADDLDPVGEASGAFDVFLGNPEGSRLEVDCLSAGQLELFLFLAALALNDEREGIVFIDEPELHLDPQWHRPMMRSLMNLQPHAQFIVATHSPEIYDAARSYERHFLVPETDPRARLWHDIRPVGTGA